MPCAAALTPVQNVVRAVAVVLGTTDVSGTGPRPPLSASTLAATAGSAAMWRASQRYASPSMMISTTRLMPSGAPSPQTAESSGRLYGRGAPSIPATVWIRLRIDRPP